MADTTTATTSHNRAERVVDAADRGSLEITPRAVTRVAEQVALQVSGVVRHSEGLEKLIGRRLPRASAHVDGSRVRLDLDVAAAWPCPVESLAAAVRDQVSAETARLTGLNVRTTDVTVHAVSPSENDPSTRRVQ